MIFSKTFSNGIKVHGIQTGTVAVRKEHFQYSGLGVFRIPKILFSSGFMPDMPIWVWVIETPYGNYLIDTGQSTGFYKKGYFNNISDEFVNRRILEIKIEEEQQIKQQLKQVGLSVEKIDAVILTHLHLDHVDGIKYFAKQEFFVSAIDWKRPIGAPLDSLPDWFAKTKKEVVYQNNDTPFGKAYQFSDSLTIVATPGHTFGHQSVLLAVDGYHIMFAGDTTFTEEQLLTSQFGGINLDLKKTRKTLKNIQKFSQETQLVYLPSHDPQSGERLQNLVVTKYN